MKKMSTFFTLNIEPSEGIPNKSRLTRVTLTTWGLTLNWEESNSLPSTASTSTTPPSPPPPPRRPRAQSWRASHRPAQVKESWEKLKSQVGPIQLGPNWESVPVISHSSCIRIMGCAIWIQNLECQITNPNQVLGFESEYSDLNLDCTEFDPEKLLGEAQKENTSQMHDSWIFWCDLGRFGGRSGVIGEWRNTVWKSRLNLISKSHPSTQFVCVHSDELVWSPILHITSANHVFPPYHRQL